MKNNRNKVNISESSLNKIISESLKINEQDIKRIVEDTVNSILKEAVATRPRYDVRNQIDLHNAEDVFGQNNARTEKGKLILRLRNIANELHSLQYSNELDDENRKYQAYIENLANKVASFTAFLSKRFQYNAGMQPASYRHSDRYANTDNAGVYGYN